MKILGTSKNLSLLMMILVGFVMTNAGWDEASAKFMENNLVDLGVRIIQGWRDPLYSTFQGGENNYRMVLAFSETLALFFGLCIAIISIIRSALEKNDQAFAKVYRLEILGKTADSINKTSDDSDLKSRKNGIYILVTFLITSFLIIGFYLSELIGSKIASMTLGVLGIVCFIGPHALIVWLMIEKKRNKEIVKVKDFIFSNWVNNYIILILPYLYLTLLMLFLLYVSPREIFKVTDLNRVCLLLYISNLFVIWGIERLVSRSILFLKARNLFSSYVRGIK